MSNLTFIKRYGETLARNIIRQGITMSYPGSLKFLLFGSEPSKQSISIKFGKWGENLFIKIIDETPHLKLLDCGLHIMENGKKKDIDLLWIDINTNKIYYRELKGNIEMDTEKIPAMLEKIKKILEPYINRCYPQSTSTVSHRNRIGRGQRQLGRFEALPFCECSGRVA